VISGMKTGRLHAYRQGEDAAGKSQMMIAIRMNRSWFLARAASILESHLFANPAKKEAPSIIVWDKIRTRKPWGHPSIKPDAGILFNYVNLLILRKPFPLDFVY